FSRYASCAVDSQSRTHDSFITSPVLDYHRDVLQQVDVTQHVAAHRDDVRILARSHRADLTVYFHQHRRPISRGSNRRHRIDSELIHPGVQLAPGALTMKVHRDAAVGSNQQHDSRLIELLKLSLQSRPSVGCDLKIREAIQVREILLD